MNDPRIQMAKKCLELLEKRRPKGLEADLKVVRETIYSLSYYPDPLSIKDYLRISRYSQLAGIVAEKLRRSLPFEEKPSAGACTALYCLKILEGLEARMDVSDPLCMIDAFYGEVITASGLVPGKLLLCLVDAGPGNGYYGGKSLKVVTNDLSVKPGRILPVAMLPPREVGGVVSEGMFITTGPGENDKALVGKRPPLGEEAGAASGIVGEFLSLQ